MQYLYHTMAFYGMGLETAVKKLNFEFKMLLKKKGGNGIRTLGRLFKQYDINGNKKLDITEFEAALAQGGLFPKKVELQALMKYYDTDQDGNITYEEFLRGLRDPMNERRTRMVEKVFTLMDRDHSGKLTIDDVADMYSVAFNKDYLSGKKTKVEIITDFLNNFDGMKGNNDGIVSKEEWIDYYTDLSMSISSDDYFIEMMESVWMVGENDEDPAFKARCESLEATLKTKLMAFCKGKDDTMLRKIFDDFDTSKSGCITIDELQKLMFKLQIAVERKYITVLFKKIDINKNGVIEFEEFTKYVTSP